MKKVYIITYDLIQPGQNYTSLIEKIRGYGTWAKIGGSSYLIITDQNPSQIRNNLRSALDPNDKLFVSFCPSPSAWHGLPEDVSKWILENQPKHS